MNEYDLFDAFGGIDEELLERSEHRAVRKFPLRKVLIAAAAVMMMVVTVFAAPVIMELLFDGALEQTTYGTTLIALDGSTLEYDDIHVIHFNVENTEGLPTSIEEYQIPHYVVDNGWTLDGGYLYSHDFGEDTNIRWVNEGVPDEWVQFEQSTINQFADWLNQAPGTNQFHIDAPQGADVTPTTISTSLGNIEGYVTASIPGLLNQPSGSTRRLHVFWRSGDYAYHTITSDTIDPELLAQIIASIAPVDDPAPYLVDNGRTGLYLVEPNPALETPVTLSTIPDGFELTECDAEYDSVNWVWYRSKTNNIQFLQTTGSIMEGNIHKYTLQQIPHTMEELTLNGNTVYFITAEDHVAALWAADGCEFGLCWNTEKSVTWEQVAEMIRSLEPVEDISAYMTE